MPGIVRLRPGSVRRRLPLAYTLSIQHQVGQPGGRRLLRSIRFLVVSWVHKGPWNNQWGPIWHPFSTWSIGWSWFFGGLQIRTLARCCDNMSCGKSFHVELGHHECARALVDSHHRSALWRWALVRAVRKRSKDPDTVIVEWLRHGAPVRMQRFSVDLEHDGSKPARDDLQGCRSLTTDVDDALL